VLLVDVIAVFAADRLLTSRVARAARARLLTRLSGVTMLGLGAYLALARREATSAWGSKADAGVLVLSRTSIATRAHVRQARRQSRDPRGP
jgi:hypothetical protein